VWVSVWLCLISEECRQLQGQI